MGEHKPTIEVACKRCQDMHERKNVEVIDVEKDKRGLEIVTFICPSCLTEQRSHSHFLSTGIFPTYIPD